MKHARLLRILLGLLLVSAGGVFVLLNQGEREQQEIEKEAFVAGLSLEEVAESDELNEQRAGTEAEKIKVAPQPAMQPVAKQAVPLAATPKPLPLPAPTPEPAIESQEEPEESPQPPPPSLLPPTPVVKQYEGCAAGQINVNSASKEKLTEITHIGDTRADQIIQLRQQEPFWSIDDLVRVSGISSARVESMRVQGLACAADPSVIPNSSLPPTLPPPPPPPPPPTPPSVLSASGGCQTGQVNVNTASLEEIVAAGIRQIGPSRAEQLIALRPFSSLEGLTRISGISENRVQEIIEQGIACVN